ncbi:hypothetical protein E2C01_090124 [Portunus trituberculatus]|uniref:Uncharacterized protein n=1 Tax=Portunus trituberculatus TaxID=210409 RepID=A0A5B7JFD7_PORTR|nr:hypothetical protein [Portunus trituberculatus]
MVARNAVVLSPFLCLNNIQLHFESKRLPGLLRNARPHCRAFWWHVEQGKTSCW